MSAEDFQLIVETVFDNSITKRDFRKLCHQPGVILNESGKKFDVIFGDVANYNQSGKNIFNLN